MPKRVDHEERRERIAAAVLRVVAAHGLEEVSLRRVATEAGVTSGMVQHYFSSKDSMIQHAMRTASAGFEQRITAALVALGDDPSPREVLRAVLGTMLPLEEDGVADARVALGFLAYAALRPALAERLGAGSAPLRDYLAEQVRAAYDAEGLVAPGDPDDLALALLAVAEGLSAQVLSHQLPVAAAASALDAQLDLVLGRPRPGVAARARRSGS